MDRLDMRDTHQHREVSPEEIRAIVAEQPEAKATDKPSNRNTRWFAEVALVKNGLQQMEDLMMPSAKEQMDEDKSLHDLYKHYNKVRKKHFNAEEEDEINALIEVRMGEIQEAARASKDRLEAMKEQIAVFASELGADYSGCEVKMRQTMHGSLCKRLHKLVREFQAMQLERKEQHKKSIMYQVKLVLRGEDGAAMDGAEVDEIVDQCMQAGSDPFAQMHEGGALWHKAESTLNDVREKHADIIKLERGACAPPPLSPAHPPATMRIYKNAPAALIIATVALACAGYVL